MVKYLLICISIFLGACFLFSFLGPSYQPSPAEKAVNTAMGRNTKKLSKKHKMHPMGVTVAMPGGDIQYLEIHFQVPGPLSKEDIRKLLVDAAHDFLTDLNNDSELCSCLDGECLSIENVGITLFFIDSFRNDLSDPHIGIAHVRRGNIEYNILDEYYDEEIHRDIPYYKYTYEETYEEALNELRKCG
ncbi:MAG: hypothetical protein K940chlam9_01224 [Chlamydiae bacterium]|nr:hypothetical protein [Chlamydiota bacterium]